VDAHLLGWAPQYLDRQPAMMSSTPGQVPPHGLATSSTTTDRDGLIQRALVEPNRDLRAAAVLRRAEAGVERRAVDFLWVQKFPIGPAQVKPGWIGAEPSRSNGYASRRDGGKGGRPPFRNPPACPGCWGACGASFGPGATSVRDGKMDSFAGGAHCFARGRSSLLL